MLRRSEVLRSALAPKSAQERVTVRARSMGRPRVELDKAVQLASFLEDALNDVEPGPRHLDIVAGLLEKSGTAGNLVTDAHIAAMAVEHDAEVVSFDNDFDRVDGVRRSRPGA